MPSLSVIAQPPAAAHAPPRGGDAAVHLVRWATVLGLVGLWEALTRASAAGGDFLTSPSRIAADGLPEVLTGESLTLAGYTTYRFLAAFAITAVAGTALGLLLGRVNRHVHLGGRDIVSVLYALPMAPFYPLFVLWLGLGDGSEIAFGVIHGLPPVVLMTMSAGAAVEPSVLDSGRAMGAGRVRRTLFLIVPACLPEIIGALKIGAALSLLGVLLAELMISVDGVGTYISLQITNHRAAALDAMVLVVCAGALAVNAALSAIEKRASRGRP
ncbi:ABC transporter permease [Actinomadura latina]|uniref:ABC transporter permease subunit n=1 Tax=Actinomadura latina TaxID=163603 RepID=A0A846YU55_9ACTN|nr:ABC transporter permease subunit [Actinomadura latina]NKZ02245.1 ABC transporter permease subunit [Actinomadura latina]